MLTPIIAVLSRPASFPGHNMNWLGQFRATSHEMIRQARSGQIRSLDLDVDNTTMRAIIRHIHDIHTAGQPVRHCDLMIAQAVSMFLITGAIWTNNGAWDNHIVHDSDSTPSVIDTSKVPRRIAERLGALIHAESRDASQRLINVIGTTNYEDATVDMFYQYIRNVGHHSHNIYKIMQDSIRPT